MGRYAPESLVKIYWLPAAASPAAPTVAEFTAGKLLTCEMETAPDLSVQGSTVEVPDLCSTLTKKIAGPESINDSAMTFWADDNPSSDAAVIEGLLARGSSGFLAIIEPKNGSVQTVTAGSTAEVWPIQITSNSKTQITRGEGRKFAVGIAATGAPVDATIAA